MDFHLTVKSKSDEGFAVASDAPCPNDPIKPLSFQSSFDLDALLDLDLCGDSYISVEDLFINNGSSQESPSLQVDAPTAITGMPILDHASQLQPCAYDRPTALTCVFVPPPVLQVEELDYELPLNQPALCRSDTSINTVVPIHVDIAVGSTRPIISACDHKPPPAASSVSFSFCQPAENDHKYCKGKPLQYPPCCSLPHLEVVLEAEQKDMRPSHDVLPNGTQLISPSYTRPPLHNLPLLTIPTAADAYRAMSGTSSPAYMNDNVFSRGAVSTQDSLAKELPSPYTLATPRAFNLSMTETNISPEGGSIEERTSSSRSCKVAFPVKTTSINLPDGFRWKKYGEKAIKGRKYKRNYFWCAEKDSEYRCKVSKHIQIDDDGEHILFTYIGRHNHPLVEKGDHKRYFSSNVAFIVN